MFADDKGSAVYEDGTPFDDLKPCIKCRLSTGPDDPDPCLGWLPSVEQACCGHGIVGEEYVVANGKRYTSIEAWCLDTGRATLSSTTERQEE